MLNGLTCCGADVNPEIVALWSKSGFEVIADRAHDTPYGELLGLSKLKKISLVAARHDKSVSRAEWKSIR